MDKFTVDLDSTTPFSETPFSENQTNEKTKTNGSFECGGQKHGKSALVNKPNLVKLSTKPSLSLNGVVYCINICNMCSLKYISIYSA